MLQISKLVLRWALPVAAFAFGAQALAAITVYSGQHKQGTQAIADAFTAKTGVQVSIKSGAGEQMAGQLAEEGLRTPADVFFSEQIPPLLSLSQRGMLAELDESIIKATQLPGVPLAENRDWVATTGRARVVVYNPERIAKKDLARSVLDYASPAWKDRIGYVPTSGAFLEQVIAITKLKGESAAIAWLEGLKQYGKLFANNKVALQAVETGRIEAALINNYYWYSLMRERGGPDKLRSRLDFIGHQDPGAIVTFAGIAVLEGSSNKEEARQFVAFAVSRAGQQAFSDVRAEYPLREDVTSAFQMLPYKDLQAPIVSPTTFADKEQATRLLERTGLK